MSQSTLSWMRTQGVQDGRKEGSKGGGSKDSNSQYSREVLDPMVFVIDQCFVIGKS